MKDKSLPYTVRKITRKMRQLFGELNIINAYWWGVDLGKNNIFEGLCHFKRYPGTKIVIGSNCTFLSLEVSNELGPYHHCIITTSASPFQAKIEIGNNCGFSGVAISAFKSIKIGNNVRCGTNAIIADGDFHLDDLRSGEPSDVVIEDNVWLGVNSVVLKGVTIGENTVIGANSVVTKSIPANVIAAGNPCRVIREL